MNKSNSKFPPRRAGKIQDSRLFDDKTRNNFESSNFEFYNVKKGFTIAELVLVIAIIGILAGIATNTYRSQSSRFSYNESITEVISLIKTARNYAVTSRMVYDTRKDLSTTPNVDESEKYIPVAGYGVHINKTTGVFTLFANTTADTNINKDQFNPDATSGDFIEETLTLPDATNFDKLINGDENSTTMITQNEAVIIFRPPLGEGFVSNNGDPTTAGNVLETITMEFSYKNPDPTEKSAIRQVKFNRIAGFPELILP